MITKTSFSALALTVVLSGGTAPPASAQSSSLKEVQVADLRTMKDKFVSLGEAFPAESYDWTPMEGVRSVKDVLILLAWEGHSYPTRWGWPAPPGVSSDRDTEMARLNALSKPQLLAELGRLFDNVIGIVEGMDDAQRMREIRFLGQAVRVEGAIQIGTSDMHEHLGQLIAYARTNHIVPPWSR